MKLLQTEIPKRNHTCSHDEKKFLSGMECYSVLYENEKFKILRKDFCKECWHLSVTPEMLKSSCGYWKSTIEKKHEKPISNRAEKSLQLLKDLSNDPQAHLSEIYILALLLAHMRRLTLRKEFLQDDKRFALYEINHQDEFLKVQIMELNSNEIATIQQKLATKLKT